MEDMPKVEKNEAVSDVENSLKKRLSKLTEELKQVSLEREEEEEKEIARVMFQNVPEILSKSFTADELDSLSSSDMIELHNVVVKTMEITKKRIETLTTTHTSVTAATVNTGEPTNEENVQPPTVKAYEVSIDNLENPPERIELEPEVVSMLASTDDNVMNSLWA